jgi:hypothetical protein
LQQIRDIRNEKLQKFTEPGEPGEKLKAQFEKLVASTHLPKHIFEGSGIKKLLELQEQVFSDHENEDDGKSYSL